MDPASVVGLLASVTQLAAQVFKVITGLHKYCRDVRAAPARSEQLQREFNNLSKFVTQLQSILGTNSNTLSRPSLEAEIRGFNEMLQEILRRTALRNTRGIQRLTWPFKEAETEEFIVRIERFKSSVNLVITVAQTYDSS
jgi:hypothetical protein